ncbi:MAG: glycoside hydrolase family 3 N-terminal domain-containing protein [bacterium]|nr:glycoside hydrolase family 3 N-terminal domain-containing protein [bacterium]
MKPKIIFTLCLVILTFKSTPANPPFIEQTCWCTWEHLILQRMSIEEKLGQLFMITSVADPQSCSQTFLDSSPYIIDQPSVEQIIKQYHVGGIIFLGIITPKKQIKLEESFQSISKIPLLIGQDLERGCMRLKNGLRFPRAMTLGALTEDDKQLIYELGKEIGGECHALGIHINFAPVADVNNNPRNVIINDRSFGENKKDVARKSILFMRGLQDAGILACAKHWPGHGDTDVDSHVTLPRINHTKERLKDIELYPFKKLIDAGVSAVMCAHLEIPAFEPQIGLPASLSKTIVTDLLRNQFQFNGLIVTDALGMQGVTKNFKSGELELHALLAGNDLLIAPVDLPSAVAHIKQALANGILTEAELDTHVLKILKVKKWVLHNQRTQKPYVSSVHAQELQEKIYRAAITLVKNEEHILPLSPSDEIIPIITIGDSSDNVFYQTLSNYLLVSLHEMPPHPTTNDLETMLEKLRPAQKIIICVYGSNKIITIEEQSLHAGAQDTTSVTYLINALQKQNKKIIVVAFESPYNLALYQNAHALIAAYENVESAQRIAALTIIGTHTPRGRLPVTACAALPAGLGLLNFCES